MGIFDDIGNFASDVFTGRWAGGGKSGEGAWGDIKADPWVLAAPAAVAAAPFVLPEIGAAAGFGAAAEVAPETIGLVGGAQEIGSVLPATTGVGGEAAAFGGEQAVGSAFASAEGAPTSLAPATSTAGVDNLMYGSTGNLEQAYPAMGVQGAPGGAPGAPTSLAPGGPGAGEGSVFDNIRKSLMGNPLAAGGALVSGGLLASNLLKGNQVPQSTTRVNETAGYLLAEGKQMTATGTQLQSYLTSGRLPPAMGAQVDQAVRAAKAKLIANAAHNGQNTNPTLNTALAQGIEDAELQGLRLAADLETKLFEKGTDIVNSGMKATGLSGQMYEWLTGEDRKDQEAVKHAVAGFATSLASFGGKGTTIKIG